ncbi:MAG: WecB/TagA/CpsF family glycosyltransferase [Lachnospiraceae bacterium]|jgi:UDP-N-acetyl-D-mannosaminuronic acid transferase (WecB/TagA/CpsF family)|nr:WecB/TagA/CpsF family glycosyltransferase [Lachnospiraceae bacterium]
MQKINILGVAITDYSLKESLIKLDSFIGGGGLNTILYVTTPMLIMAGENEEEKNEIEAMDMTLCGDADILKVAEIKSVSRLYEVENQVFLKEFLRRLVLGGGKVYLLAESEEEVDSLQGELENIQKDIQIVGKSVIPDGGEGLEEIINWINDIAPIAVISRFPSGGQEKWMIEAKPFVNAEVWLGISKDMVLNGTKEPFRKKVSDKIYKKIFRRRINRFRDENERGE